MRTVLVLSLALSTFGISKLTAGPCTIAPNVWNEGDNGEGDAGKPDEKFAGSGVAQDAAELHLGVGLFQHGRLDKAWALEPEEGGATLAQHGRHLRGRRR